MSFILTSYSYTQVETQSATTPSIPEDITTPPTAEPEEDVSIVNVDVADVAEAELAVEEVITPTSDDASKPVERADAEVSPPPRPIPEVVAKYAEAGVYISPPETSTIELGPGRWDGKTIEEATMEILEVSGQKFGAEESLISLGLSSMSALDIIDLVEHRTGRSLEPEEIEVSMQSEILMGEAVAL